MMFYTYNSDTKRLTRAPDPVTIGGKMIVHPTAALYALIGAYPLGESIPPTPPEGKIAVPDGYALQGGEWVQQWRFDDATPRRWTRLTIKTALAKAGLLADVLEYLALVEIAPGYSAAAALQDCDYIEEGYPDDVHWDEILEGVTIALGKSRAEIDVFLDSLPTEL